MFYIIVLKKFKLLGFGVYFINLLPFINWQCLYQPLVRIVKYLDNVSIEMDC